MNLRGSSKEVGLCIGRRVHQVDRLRALEGDRQGLGIIDGRHRGFGAPRPQRLRCLGSPDDATNRMAGLQQGVDGGTSCVSRGSHNNEHSGLLASDLR